MEQTGKEGRDGMEGGTNGGEERGKARREWEILPHSHF